MSVKAFRDIHAGGCVILGNGPTLTDHSNKPIPIPVIGTNRSLDWATGMYHVVPDAKSFVDYGPQLEAFWNRNGLFAVEGRPFGHQLKILDPRRHQAGWSWDIEEGVHVRGVVYVAMQIAVYMGFSRLLLLGVDLVRKPSGASHFYPREDLQDYEAFQREAFGYAAGIGDASRRFSVKVCSNITTIRSFQRTSFENGLQWARFGPAAS